MSVCFAKKRGTDIFFFSKRKYVYIDVANPREV